MAKQNSEPEPKKKVQHRKKKEKLVKKK